MNSTVAIIADRLQPPYDEGIKNIAVNFIREMGESHAATLITDNGTSITGKTCLVPLGKTFLKVALWRVLRRLQAGVIFYLPSTSLTFSSVVRGAAIKALSPRSKVFIMGLQSRRLSKPAKMMLRLIGPAGVIVLSEAMRREMRGLSATIEIFTPGVDIRKFRPASADERAALRAKHNIPLDAHVVLHVGHVKRSRNLTTVLEALEGSGSVFLVVGSSTFEHEKDHSLLRRLGDAGVIIVSGAIDAIEELYQLADCYVFPVTDRRGATEMPLSVLEAMAVNIPVVTTPYGALVDAFTEDPAAGFFYATEAGSFAAALKSAARVEEVRTRALVDSYSWQGRVAALMERLKVRQYE